MRRPARIVALVGAAAGVAAAMLAGWFAVTMVSAADLPPLRNGDLVFQYARGFQGQAIRLASNSYYTHMGIVKVDAAGKAWVVEAAGPVRTTALDQWIGRGAGGRIAVKRVSDLSEAAAAKALAEAGRYEGRPYDLYFLDGDDQIYCSELVRLAFADGPGIVLGEVQQVKSLDLDHSSVRGLIERRWRHHPSCRNGAAATLEACYRIILDQTLVTPASIARDAKLHLVYSNFGWAGD
jgi:hypothetical protein